MDYNFSEIEKKWQQYWEENQVYKVTEDQSKPKYYVLDMFPYPSGAGLHVGHPLGYIASDIYSRYKRQKGFNVLHPMGFDAYGLPAEQYAIQTGQHPAITTEKNIQRYKEQLDKIGFSFDWSREVRTCDPEYYKWTQWAFVKMFHSYYCYQAQQARPIEELVGVFEMQGTKDLDIACSEELSFTAEEWKAKSEKEQQETLMNYRIAYLGDSMVNWCPALGTVLANDEVIDGLSERGGHPVEQRKMRQWCLRVSAYAQRLLDGLDTVDWTESLKETQKNWIGRSEGAELTFNLSPCPSPQDHLPPTPSQGGGVTSPQPPPKEGETPRYCTTHRQDWNANISNAKEMRRNPTEAESILWKLLRNRNFGVRFRRQHLIGPFIVDFVCLEKQLIIEADGGYHNEKGQKEADEERTNILNKLGYKVIRFINNEIIGDIDNVVVKIKQQLQLPYIKEERTAKSNSPSLGGGLGEVSPGERLEGGGEIVVFTTRADTIYGVTFMVLAPESEYVCQVVTPEQEEEVARYIESVKSRTERERQIDKKVTGVFTGSYAINPVSGAVIPIWIADYVLAGYGTGAIMAVPGHDSRDYAFAKHFNLPIIPLIEGADISEESFDAKEGIMMNSGFLNGLTVKEAIEEAKTYIEEEELGTVKVNYRLRDAIFSRQRYWGEPFPIYYKDGMPYTVAEEDLPVKLPDVDKYLPTESGEPPLGRAKNWTYKGYPLELNTMPGFAGSSAYYIRYEDPHNDKALVSKEANEYWRNVDLYIGGTEHATGHLIYSRFWNKFLFDLGVVCEDEPYKKLVNQGMIQGRSNFVYRIKDSNTFVSLNLKDKYDTTSLHVDVNIVHGDVLDTDAFRQWRPEFKDAEFILEDGKYICGWAVEKMSKSMYNVVNPDDIVERFGADTLRLYEMFLGPLEQSKPWDTNGIDGVSRFLRKLWNLFYKKDEFIVTNEQPTADELKALHKLIKKAGQDIENFSFNTSVAAFMICVNELTALDCHKRAILSDLIIVVSSFAPFIGEELWHALGNTTTVCNTRFPDVNEEYLKENSITYSISFNGKTRFTLCFPADAGKEEIEQTVLAHPDSQKWIDGKTPKKVIVVPGKIVNIVV